MVRVGVRELRQRASELLRMVQQGEIIEITDRGHPVAQLGPLPQGRPLERLRQAGEIVPASGAVEDLPEPLALESDREAPSATLERLRRDER